MERYDEDNTEILLADEQSPLISEIKASTTDLLFDSEDRFIPAASATRANEEEWVEVFANYVLRGEVAGESKSRHIGLAYDPRGLLVVMRSFSEDDTVPLPTARPIEMVPLEDTEAPIAVSFFSYLLPGADVRIEGVESDACNAELTDLLGALRHSGLTEVAGPEPTVRYAALTIAMLRTYSQLRPRDWEKFIVRKRIELEEWVDARDAEAEVVEAKKNIEKLTSEREELAVKIDHPVRGILSDAAQHFSGKLARRILGI